MAVQDTIDFTDLEKEYAVEMEEGFGNIVIVDGIPIVDEAKKEKLMVFLKKIFKSCGSIKEEGIHMPMVDGKSKGFCFVEFESVEVAKKAVKFGDGYRMDKVHVLSVNNFDDIANLEHVSEEFVVPEEKTFVAKDHLKSWLADPLSRDQIAVHQGDQVQIYWNGKDQAPEEVVERKKWTEMFIKWSPKGSFLATIKREGVALSGGQDWMEIVLFEQQKVSWIDFSPNEKYLVTCSKEGIVAGGPFSAVDDGNHVVVWDVRTGLRLRSFLVEDLSNIEWPFFQWSPCDSYFSRLVRGKMISIYESATMTLLEKKSMKINGVQELSWSPLAEKSNSGKARAADQLLAYWTPEIGDQPARITVMRVPDREVLRTKNFFSVSECKLYWNYNGDYLCVKVERIGKSKKQSQPNFDLFHIREKGIPIDSLDLNDAQFVVGFSWEPQGRKFATILTSDDTTKPGQIRTTVSVYDVERKADAVGSIKLIGSADKKNSTRLHWSPRGRFFVSSDLSHLEFWDAEYEAKEGKLHSLGQSETTAIGLEWDSTGRYVMTSCSRLGDSGYVLYDFKGAKLYEMRIDRLKQIMFRPRPESLLTKNQVKAIQRNLKDYSDEFDVYDSMSKDSQTAQMKQKRGDQYKSWLTWRLQKLQHFIATREKRDALRKAELFDDEERTFVVESEAIQECLESGEKYDVVFKRKMNQSDEVTEEIVEE